MSRILGSLQSLARGAGYGRSARDSAYEAALVKEQTDEHDRQNLDAAVFAIDTYNKKVFNDWNIYQQSLVSTPDDPNPKPRLPEGFTGTAEDYEKAHARATRNLSEHKFLLPSDIEAMYGKPESINYENISGSWPNILGPGKYMNPVTSREDSEGNTNFQVRTLDPDTGKLHDADPTWAGVPERILASRGPEAQAAGTWPSMPNDARDTIFKRGMANLYRRTPGASSAMLNLADREVNLDPFSSARALKEEEELQALVKSDRDAYGAAVEAYETAKAQFADQEAGRAESLAETQAAKRKELEEKNAGIRAANTKIKEAAELQIENPEGTGYGVDDPNTPDVDEALPMGRELYDRLPKWIKTGGIGDYQATYALENPATAMNPDMAGLEGYVATKRAIPLNMTREQWRSLTVDQRTEIQGIHDRLVANNLQRMWREGVSTSGGKIRGSKLAEEIKAYKERPVPEGTTINEYEATLKKVEEFYDRFNATGQGGQIAGKLPKEDSAKESFWQFLQNNPEELKAFRESPFAFAQKHTGNPEAITGTPADPAAIADADLEGIQKEINIEEVIKTLDVPAGTLTQESVDELSKEAEKLQQGYKIREAELARLIEQNQIENRRLNKEHRAAIGMAVLSTFAQGDARFGQVLNALPSWMERGNWDDFKATFDQDNRKLDQVDAQISQTQQNINLRAEELYLNRDKLTQQQYETRVKLIQDLNKALDDSMGGSPFVKAAISDVYKTAFGKNMLQTGDDFDANLETAFTAEGFRAYMTSVNAMISQLNQVTKTLPQSRWTPQMKADAVAIQSTLAAGVKQFLRAEEARSTSLWTKIVTLLPFVTREGVGAGALDEVSQLVAYTADDSLAESIGEVAKYKHINPRTGESIGEDIPAFQLHRVFGEYGGRELLWGLSAPNNELLRARAGN